MSFGGLPEFHQLLGQARRNYASIRYIIIQNFLSRDTVIARGKKFIILFKFVCIFSGEKYETLIVDSGYKVYMKLRIRNVTENDFLEYKCVAKNSLGGSDGSITLYGNLLGWMLISLFLVLILLFLFQKYLLRRHDVRLRQLQLARLYPRQILTKQPNSTRKEVTELKDIVRCKKRPYVYFLRA